MSDAYSNRRYKTQKIVALFATYENYENLLMDSYVQIRRLNKIMMN